MTASTPKITLRPLQVDDLPLVHGWLNNDPAALKWVSMGAFADMSHEAFVSHFQAGMSFTKCQSSAPHAVKHWMALLVPDDDDDETGKEPLPLGWAQTWCGADMARGEAWAWRNHLKLGITGGMDYLIGEETQRGRGLGSAMISTLVKDVVFANNPDLTFAAACFGIANIASQKALENAGLKQVCEIQDEDGTFVLMAVHREEFMGGGTRDITKQCSYDKDNADEDSSTCCSYNDYDFDDLATEQQNAVLFLGYSKQMWDNDEEPKLCELSWDRLSSEQQAAAKHLAYNKDKWDDDGDSSSSCSSSCSDCGSVVSTTDSSSSGSSSS